MSITRKTTAVYGLGEGVTQDDEILTGAKLPTIRSVIRCVRYHLQQSNGTMTLFEASKKVYPQIKNCYVKAGLKDKMIADKSAIDKLKRYVEKDNKFRNMTQERRDSEEGKQMLVEHILDLDKTFLLTVKNALDLPFQNDDDRKFLISMMSDRIATIEGKDRALYQKEERKTKKVQQQKAYRQKKLDERRDLFKSVSSRNVGDTDSSLSEVDVENDTTFTLEEAPSTSSGNYGQKNGACLYIPPDILSKKAVVETLTRCKITPAAASSLLNSIIMESTYIGEESCTKSDLLSRFSISYASCDRYKRKINETIADDIKDKWEPKSNEPYNLHWDSKIIPGLSNKYQHLEVMPVLLSSGKEIKLLGVPNFQAGSDEGAGNIIGNLTYDLLNDWNCSENVVSMVFDTTSSNTGQWSGGCIEVQNRLQKHLLWNACRKHVGELIVGACFNCLDIEVSKGPEILLFKKFRTYFEIIPHVDLADDELNFPNYDRFSSSQQRLLLQWREETIEVALKYLRNEGNLAREDYKELLELVLFAFKVPLPDEKPFKFRRPGAISKARWMGKMIYGIKMFLLSKQISVLKDPKNSKANLILNSRGRELEKLTHFVTFVVHVYVKWWFTCSSATNAPVHDLRLFNQLQSYKEINAKVAEAAITTFNRHLWYLCEEYAPISLFSNEVPDMEKATIVQHLKSFESGLSCPAKRHGTKFGKPAFPVLDSTTTLASLIGPDSWYFFKLLNIDASFLNEPVVEWNNCEAYKSSKHIVQKLNVVNDSAERGVKLASDFAETAKTSCSLNNTLQVVEKSRKEQPNLRKRRRMNLQ